MSHECKQQDLLTLIFLCLLEHANTTFMLFHCSAFIHYQVHRSLTKYQWLYQN